MWDAFLHQLCIPSGIFLTFYSFQPVFCFTFVFLFIFFRFKGIKKGGVTENASYYIFTQCPDGAFEAFPVHGWYNFTQQAKHRTLTAEEAEEEWGRYVNEWIEIKS